MTPNDVIKYLNNLAKFIKQGEQEMQVLVTSAMTGIITGRIFNNISGSKNTNDTSLGVYSPQYAKQKAKKFGKSLSTKVNLYYTGTLFGSVKQVKKDDVYIAVTDVKYPKTNTIEVASHLEKQYGQIFAPTTPEEEEAISIATKYAIRRANEFKP